jgi:ornithine carbamoyltransferase
VTPPRPRDRRPQPAELRGVLDLAEDPSARRSWRADGRALLREAVAAHPPLQRDRGRAARRPPVTFRKDEIGGQPRAASTTSPGAVGLPRRLGRRVFDHRILEQLAACASIPVVNLLSDEAHPCQSLADLLTMRQEWGASRAAPSRGSATSTTWPAACRSARPHRHAPPHRQPAGYGPARPTSTRSWRRLDGRRSSPTAPRGGARRRRRPHRRVGVDGPGGRGRPRRRAFEGFQVDDTVMAGARATPCSCTACPPTGARRWRPRSSTARRAGCSPGPQPPPRLPRPPPLPPGRPRMTKTQRQHRIAKLLAEQR